MIVWVLSVSYGFIHGIYSSKEKALAAALQYAEEDICDEKLFEEIKEGLNKSYNKGGDYFCSEGYDSYIEAECWPVDAEYEVNKNETN